MAQGYAGVPEGPLSAYLGVRDMNERRSLSDLQHVMLAQQLKSKLQDEQRTLKEDAEIKGVVQQAQGDVNKAVKGLVEYGSPKSLGLAEKMKGMIPKPTEPYTLGADQIRYDANNNPIAFGAPKTIEPKAPTSRKRVAGEMEIQEEFDSKTGTWREIGRGPRFGKQVAAPDKPVPETNFTPDAIEQAAGRYAIDGSLPPNLGRGVQGTVNTAAILNRAAQIAKEGGDAPEEARIRQIAGRASTQALGQLVKQKNLILAFEKNALLNADLVLDRSEKVDRMGSPAIDRWIMSGKKNIVGDSSVAELDAAMRTFVNEYARITTSVTGGGVTSDTARREIDELLKSAHTKEQVRNVVKLMKQEMENRRIGYEQQEESLKKSFAKPAAPTPSPSPTPAGSWSVVR